MSHEFEVKVSQAIRGLFSKWITCVCVSAEPPFRGLWCCLWPGHFITLPSVGVSCELVRNLMNGKQLNPVWYTSVLDIWRTVLTRLAQSLSRSRANELMNPVAQKHPHTLHYFFFINSVNWKYIYCTIWRSKCCFTPFFQLPKNKFWIIFLPNTNELTSVWNIFLHWGVKKQFTSILIPSLLFYSFPRSLKNSKHRMHDLSVVQRQLQPWTLGSKYETDVQTNACSSLNPLALLSLTTLCVR